jgi:succinate dehydrogenase hydrophobic anchor subunit
MLKTRLHFLFLMCGLGLLVVLGIHMGIQHLNHVLATGDPDPTSWQSMISRAIDGSWVVVYILLLAFVLYHALYGLRGIILELTTSQRAVRVINWVFIIGGIVVFAWGTYVLFYLF